VSAPLATNDDLRNPITVTFID